MRKRNFLVLAFVGAAAFLTGIFTAPDKGENTVKKLKKGVDDVKNEIGKDVHNAQDKVEEVKNNAVDFAKEKVDQLTDNVNEIVKKEAEDSKKM